MQGQEDFFLILCQATSTVRLDAYRQRRIRRNVGDSDLEVCADYLWNIALCESLYPVLQWLEVTLRNNLHESISALYGSNWFNSSIIQSREADTVQKAKERLTRLNKPLEVGRIVAELNLGFWVSLFDKRYENRQRFWPSLFSSPRRPFPNLPRTNRTRDFLSSRLNKLLELRNRVFHHEPIYYWRDLTQQHEMIIEIIGWLNPSVAQIVQTIDRFREVYQGGSDIYIERLRVLWTL